MDRHDAKPRRPSLMAGAEPQHPAPGVQPARILADLPPAPAPRRPRRPRHVRAVLIGGLGLLAVAAVGWALVGSGNDIEPPPMAATSAVTEPPAPDPSTATLVDAPSTDGAGVANPFDSEDVAQASLDTASTDSTAPVAGPAVPVEPAATPNPFSSIDAPSAHHRPGAAPPRPMPATEAAPKRVARPTVTAQSTPAASRPASPRTAGREAGLLQTLMDNIQQPGEPARDTRAMDRLARRLDRTPMPESAPTVVATAAAPARASSTTAKPAPSPAANATDAAATTPIAAAAVPAASARGSATAAAGGAAQQKLSLRALLDQCPASNSAQSQRCRRQMCARAGVDPRRCARH